jgi:hypothetical protein
MRVPVHQLGLHRGEPPVHNLILGYQIPCGRHTVGITSSHRYTRQRHRHISSLTNAPIQAGVDHGHPPGIGGRGAPRWHDQWHQLQLLDTRPQVELPHRGQSLPPTAATAADTCHHAVEPCRQHMDGGGGGGSSRGGGGRERRTRPARRHSPTAASGSASSACRPPHSYGQRTPRPTTRQSRRRRRRRRTAGPGQQQPSEQQRATSRAPCTASHMFSFLDPSKTNWAEVTSRGE